MHGTHARFTLDVDPRGLVAGTGVCGSALALPFADACFDVVGAVDVLEHCAPEARVLAELRRVLVPGGRLLVSVPAYQWAWTDHDVRAGHHRRYTRARLRTAVEGAGLEVLRATYGFAGVFPVFAAARLARQRRERRGAAPLGPGLPQVPPALDALLTGVSHGEARLLRHRDLPFGSSVFLAARRPVG
jgi:SAM-dependent methyltransferase